MCDMAQGTQGLKLLACLYFSSRKPFSTMIAIGHACFVFVPRPECGVSACAESAVWWIFAVWI